MPKMKTRGLFHKVFTEPKESNCLSIIAHDMWLSEELCFLSFPSIVASSEMLRNHVSAIFKISVSVFNHLAQGDYGMI